MLSCVIENKKKKKLSAHSFVTGEYRNEVLLIDKYFSERKKNV